MSETIFFVSMFGLSFFTAAISAATGMGGGVIFLVGLNFFVPLNQAIPLHGIVQLKNNALRVFKLRKYLRKDFCLPFFIGCLLGVISISFLRSLVSDKLIPLILIFLLVNYSLFKPKKMPELKIPSWGFYLLGYISGFLGVIIGAVDPLLAPFFIRDDLSRQEIIANKSFFQTLVHFSKIPIFLSLGFDYLNYWQLILLLLAGGFLGTLWGIKLLHSIKQELFIKIFRTILFLVGIKLAYNIFVLMTH